MRSSIDSLEPRRLLAGITLITHGLQTSGYPQWLDRMAEAVDQRIEPAAPTLWSDVSLYRMVMATTTNADAFVQSFTRTNGPAPSASHSGEVVIALDWASISGLSGPTTATVATAVLNQLLASGPALGFGGDLLSLPIQLMGHSRGGSLVADLARQMGQHGIWVDQLTTFDAFPLPSDASATVYDNVVYADNYYETHDFLVHGSAIAGAHNSGPLSLSGGSSLDHSDTHTYYDGTIARGATSDGDVTINDAWYTGANSNNASRATTGFDWSRISGAPRPNDGTSSLAGGSASRTHVAVTSSPWSNVGSLSIGGADANGFITDGASINLNYRYQDSAGGGAVSFYLDDDTNPYDGFARSLGNQLSLAATGAQPASAPGSVAATWSSAGLSAGAYYVYASINDAAIAHTRYLYITQPLFVTGAGADLISKRWSDDLANQSWTEPRNWSPGGVPTGNDRTLISFDSLAPSGTISNLAIDLTSSATVTLAGAAHIRAINLAGASTLNDPASASLLVTQTLTVAGSAMLNLSDNDLIVDYTGTSPLALLQSSINQARGSGWLGAGISSSSAAANPLHNTTLGAMEATDYRSLGVDNTTFDGEPIDTTAVLIKYTYYGDANFNGKVDGGDYARIDTTFNAEPIAGNIGGWLNGDFDGNGKVDGADYGLIDSTFNSQSLVLRAANPPAPRHSPETLKRVW